MNDYPEHPMNQAYFLGLFYYEPDKGNTNREKTKIIYYKPVC